MQPTIRTQISLTPEIKHAIEEHTRMTGESMSEYLRQAATLLIRMEKEKRKTMKKIAQTVIGSVSLSRHPQWKTKGRVNAWVEQLRKAWE